LHKGFKTIDSSYGFGRKKRSLSANSSNYEGLPYRIYSATPGYQYKKWICNYIFIKIFLAFIS
jgi:hypothetical protein